MGTNKKERSWKIIITFDPLRKTMKKKGISTYTLQDKYGFNPADISRLKYNHNYTLKMVDRLCKILQCQPGDVIGFTSDETEINNDVWL